MKCNPLRWLWGLLPVVGLGWLATQLTHADIEADIKKRVDSQLSSSGFKWQQTGFSGRDGVLTGVAGDEADPGRAADIARSIWGVRVVDNKASVVEKVDKYLWSATKSGSRVVLGGFVPSDATRAEIVKQAKASFPGLEIADDMKLARGVPGEAWLSGVSFGMKQLAALKAGDAKLDGLSLAVSGEALDSAKFRAVKTALASELPRGVRLSDEKVTGPVVKPYVWAAKHAAGQLLLSGYVPERARAEVNAAAKAAFPRATINDRMEAAEGAANGYAAAVTTALRELGKLEEGNAEMRDAALSVQGLAPSPDAQSAVRQALGANAVQGFAVTHNISARDNTPQRVSPYTTAVVADAGSVILSGYAPTEAAREQIAQTARTNFPTRRIDNRMQIAPGAPAGWQNCMDQAMAGVARLSTARFAMTDATLDVAGATDDEDLVTSVPRSIRDGVKADCQANVRIDQLAEATPELVWRASYKGNDVVLEGDVSSAAARSGLIGSAQRLFPGRNIVDRMRIIETRTKTWPLVAEKGLVALSGLKEGTATLTRRDLAVVGEAADQPTVARVRSGLAAGLIKGYSAQDQIRVASAVAAPVAVPPPPAAPQQPNPAQACQASLQATAREGIIRFERASATLTNESLPTLDRLATAARTCGSVMIEIEGHTDSEGAPDRNQRLSDRRAKSVVDYLAQKGVNPQQLAAIGYGETRPLVPNDSAENRAKNRRIEFTVKPRT